MFLDYFFSAASDRYRFDIFYVFIITGIMVSVNAAVLGFSQFFIALFLPSTAIWLDFRVYSVPHRGT